MICDNEIIRTHPLYARYHYLLNDISEKDYPGKNYIRTDVDSISLDEYEGIRSEGTADKTMDAVVGVADISHNRKVGSRLLMVELRMGYDDTNNLKISSLQGKVIHSGLLLGGSVPLDEECVFVFRVDVAEQAKKWIFGASKESTIAEKWVALSTDELNNLLKSEKEIPYQPENNMAFADKQMLKLIADKDMEGLLNHIDYWHNKADSYRIQYKLMEQNHIQQHLHDVWQDINTVVDQLDVDQLIMKEFLEEEFPFLR